MARTRRQRSPQNLYKYDVLIEDSGPRSDYFRLTQFDGYFTGGRNAFLVAGATTLQPRSKILVEVLDKDGGAVFSTPVPGFIEGNSRLVQVEVYQDTPIGRGKLVILGCTDTYLDGTPVPPEWRNKYNVRWITDITISPRVENRTPIRFERPPQLVVEEKFYNPPESSSFFSNVTESLNFRLEPKYFNVFPNGYVALVAGTPTERYFTKHIGGKFTGSLTLVTPDGVDTLVVDVPITRIFNRATAESEGKILYTQNGTLVTDLVISASGTYSASLNKNTPVLVSASNVVLSFNELVTDNIGLPRSFVDVRVVDLSTISGEVAKVRLSYKRTTDPGEYVALSEFPTNVRELLAVDENDQIVETGQFRATDFTQYWYSTTASFSRGDVNPSVPVSYTNSSTSVDFSLQSCVYLLDAITAIPPIVSGSYINDVVSIIGTKENNTLSLFPRSEYTLAFDALVSKTSGSVELFQDDYSMEVYLMVPSGSTGRVLTTDPRGQLLGTLTPDDFFVRQNFETVEFNFTPQISGSGEFGLRFVMYGGHWNIANVSIKPATERFFSPDEVNVIVPNEFRHDELVTYQAEFLDIDNNSLEIVATSLPTNIEGIGYVSRDGDTMWNELEINGIPIYRATLLSQYTGLISGGIINTSSVYPQAYTISPGIGIVIGTDDPRNPTYKFVEWPELTVTASAFATSGSIASYSRTNIAIIPDPINTGSFVASGTQTGVAYSGSVFEQSGSFTALDYRDKIVLGRIAHVNSTNIQRALSLPLTATTKHSHWFDYIYNQTPVNISGNIFSAAGTNLQIQKSAGQTYRIGSNYRNDPDVPDITSDTASNPTTFAYRYRSGTPDVFLEQPVTTFVSSGFYDNGSGTLQTVNNNQWTIQHIYYFGATNTTRIQYGQAVYNSKADAELAVGTEPFVADPNLEADAVFRGYLVLRGGPFADLSNTDNAEFLEPRTGGGGGGGGGAESLAQLSDVSLTTPTDGDVLLYTSSVWVNTSIVPSASRAIVAEEIDVLSGGSAAGVGSYTGSFTGSVSIARQTITHSTSLISLGGSEQSHLNMNMITGYLNTIVTSHDCRICLYSSASARTSDFGRDIAEDPEAGIGVLAEFVTTANQTLDVSPVIFLKNSDIPSSHSLYYTIYNQAPSSASIAVSMSVLPLEI
jgi:hypothetical protein